MTLLQRGGITHILSGGDFSPLTSVPVICQVQESVVTRLREHKLTRKLFESRSLDAVDAEDARVRVQTLEPEDPRVQDVSEQLQLDPYPVRGSRCRLGGHTAGARPLPHRTGASHAHKHI